MVVVLSGPCGAAAILLGSPLAGAILKPSKYWW